MKSHRPLSLAWICLAVSLLFTGGLSGQVVTTSSSTRPISEQFRWMPVPATLSSPGKPGDFASDGTDLYIYTGTGRPPHSWIVAGSGGSGTVTSVNGVEPSAGNVTLTPTDLGAATAPTSTTLSGGGPYALTLGPAPYPRYTVAISAATTFTVSGSPNAGDGAIIENTVSGAPRVVTYPTAYRNNAAATSTSVSVSSPRSEFFLKYTGSEYRWSDNEYTADDAASLNYADDTGSANAYAITLAPVPTAYTKGTQYRFKAANANTGASTLNVNGLGTKTIVKYAGGPNTALVANDIRAGQMIICVYDGTYMQMQSTSGNPAIAQQLGTQSSPDTTGGAIAWDSPMYMVWTNTTTTYALPAASAYVGRGVIFYVTGTNAVTIDPNGSEVIVREGVAQTGGVTLTLTGTAGNYVALFCTGTRWVTIGKVGTLAAGS